jgi:hypothetical protein
MAPMAMGILPPREAVATVKGWISKWMFNESPLRDDDGQ